LTKLFFWGQTCQTTFSGDILTSFFPGTDFGYWAFLRDRLAKQHFSGTDLPKKIFSGTDLQPYFIRGTDFKDRIFKKGVFF